jgi:hypothetical protein
MEEFTNPTGLKIFNSLFAFIFAGASFFFLNHVHAGIWATVLPIGLLISAFLIAANQVKTKIMVSADNIVSITAFSRKELSTAKRWYLGCPSWFVGGLMRDARTPHFLAFAQHSRQSTMQSALPALVIQSYLV